MASEDPGRMQPAPDRAPALAPVLWQHAGGLLALVAGAGLTDLLHSMWPLAAGAAVAVMTSAVLTRVQWQRAVHRRRNRRRGGG